MKLTNLSVSHGIRRAARPPGHRRNLPTPARAERRAQVPILTVRLGRMAPVAAGLPAVLAAIEGGSR